MATTTIETSETELAPGTRVEIDGDLINVTFRSRSGVIARPDKWINCYIVRLDQPAMYRLVDGEFEDLEEIRVDILNINVVTP